MTVFDERPPVPVSQKKLRLIVLPALALLVWVGVATYQPHRLQKSLQEFRGEAAGETGPNRSMDSSLIIRHSLLLHSSVKLSTLQSAALVAAVTGPADEQDQSEALDVLGLAQRAHALSPAQARQAGLATISVLQHNPGPMVRLESARLLGHLGDRASLPALLVLQQDSDPKIREAAEQALTRIQK